MNPLPSMHVLLLDGDSRQCLPVAKALRKSGHKVSVLCHEKISFGSWSRYPNFKVFGPDCMKQPDEYFDFLSELLKTGRYDITIPLFDYTATIASKHKDELGKYTKLPIPDYDTFILARDKSKTMQMCEKANVAHPKTYSLQNESAADIATKIDFPCIVKPNIGHGAIGIRRVQTADELVKVCEEVTTQYGPSCVQEFIPQTGTQYKTQLFRSGKGKIHGSVVFSKIRYFPVTGGTSSMNITVDRPDIIEMCVRLLDEMNWVFHADVDLIEDPRDGTIKVMEINPRITGSIKIAFEAGVDFADLLVREVTGQELPTYDGYRVGIQMRYMPLDILWFLYSPDRFRARPGWFKFWGHDMCYQEGSLDDPFPFAAAFVSGLKKFINPTFRRGKLGKTK